MDSLIFPGRLGFQQRVLPNYRAPFFDALAQVCAGGMSLFAGLPRPSEGIVSTEQLQFAQHVPARNIHLFEDPFYLCYQQGMLNWLEAWDPNVLIVEANPRYLSTSAALRWMRQRERPTVGWGLGAPALRGPFAGLRRARRLSFIRQFDALISYSRRGADEYAALGFPTERIFVAPNATAPRPVVPLPRRPSAFAERPVVLFVGRLQRRKRVDNLLHACAALPQSLRPKLVIVGDGPQRPELETLAQRIYPGIEFVGAKHGHDLDPHFTAADLFVLPGTGGLAVQEAMSFGLPVIMARGDGTQDDLIRAENGWQVPPDDLPALTETLRAALSDTQRLRSMGRESYRIAREEINLERMVGVFAEVLIGLLR